MPNDKGQIFESSNLAGTQSESKLLNPARIYEIPRESRCLDPTELAKLEQSFRSWAEDSPRPDVRESRRRILLIFLLIRYTGARLNEVLTLDLGRNIDVTNRIVRYGNVEAIESSSLREVQISSELMSEIRQTMNDLSVTAKRRLVIKSGCRHMSGASSMRRAVACGFATGSRFP